MKKNQGFTLIELLAVIVVLAVIALIATPLILGVIEKSKKGAFEASAKGMIKAVDYYQMNHMDDEIKGCVIFNFSLGNTERVTIDSTIYEPIKELNVKGTIPNEGEISLCNDVITAKFGNEKYTYIKDSLGDKVVEGRTTESDTLLNNEILKNNGGIDAIKAKVQPNFIKAAISSANFDSQPDTTYFTKDENGMYTAMDDYGTTYYFRGAVDNNYVIYGGFCWRIVRINGDESIRLLYQGKSCSSKELESTIGTSAFNTTYNDNANVGYMYGKLNATTYEETHANTTDSTVKTYIDKWYEKNLKGKSYEKYISDTLFCNDRSVTTGTGIGTYFDTKYSAYSRISSINTSNPILTCKNKNDRFTVNDTNKGNGDLKYSIALLTGDEMSMAGILMRGGSVTITNAINKDVYIYSGKLGSVGTVSTITPWAFRNTYYAGNIEYGEYGSLNFFKNDAVRAIKPVINLSSKSPYKGGNGTLNNPYRIY